MEVMSVLLILIQLLAMTTSPGNPSHLIQTVPQITRFTIHGDKTVFPNLPKHSRVFSFWSGEEKIENENKEN